jgi:hypothetical protein
LFGRLTVKMRVSRRVSELRRTVIVDTRRLREKTIRRLKEIFRIASDYARGRVDRVTDDDGRMRLLTIPERQFWARIAAYTVQIINTIAKGINEREIDEELDELEAMLNKRKTENKAEADKGEAAGKLSG